MSLFKKKTPPPTMLERVICFAGTLLQKARGKR